MYAPKSGPWSALIEGSAARTDEPKTGAQSASIAGGIARRDLELETVFLIGVGFEAKDTNQSTRTEVGSWIVVEAGWNFSAGKAGEGIGRQSGRVCTPKGGTLACRKLA
ncbi:hypothetical protein DFH08DRAFT_818658 [Mycena albidolilacea]|uniref:Uncharacterized protein n=1 Tax=Mycena albidolilacea TaxID=1033008 RepID=A0AAD6ZGH2_9AGAR|nr:hypothetical protein DFH08DRAFT_818658 [Mycena albidolilacea]